MSVALERKRPLPRQTALELLMAGIGWLGLKYGRPADHDAATSGPASEYPGEAASRAAAARHATAPAARDAPPGVAFRPAVRLVKQ